MGKSCYTSPNPPSYPKESHNMKTQRFEVLSQTEVERIHAASMEILAEVGIKVSYKTARDIYRDAGAIVDDHANDGTVLF